MSREHELWAAAQLAPGEGIEDGVARIAAILRLAAPQPEPVAWKHECAALCTNEVELWIDACPHCGKPRTAAPPAAPAPAVPLTDADLDRIADAVPVDDIGVHITTWHRRFARAVLSAAPVVREPLPREQQIAIREAHCNTASDEYFGARPSIDSLQHQRAYEAGFKEGWESAHGIGGGGISPHEDAVNDWRLGCGK